MGNMSSPNSLQINEEKARAGKRKQGKARESEGTPGKPIKRDAKRTWKQSKRKHGITRERRQKQGKPRARQSNIRIASPAELAPLASVAGKQKQVRKAKGSKRQQGKARVRQGKQEMQRQARALCKGKQGKPRAKSTNRCSQERISREKQEKNSKTMQKQ